MLGQDDNPGNIEEENRRSVVGQDAAESENLPVAYDDKANLDPRSFKAKSVPQRMAIISAGVFFNLFFAVIFAAIAFRSGVDYAPVVIGGVTPGGPAWENDLTGARILRIGDKPVEGYFPYIDLVQEVAMNGADKPLVLEYQKPDSNETVVARLTPRPGMSREIDFPLIGVQPASSATVADKNPTMVGNPAYSAEPPILGGDTIESVNGTPINSAYDLQRTLAIDFDKPVSMVLKRKATKDGRGGELVTTVIGPNPRRELGLIMKWKPVADIQQNSPAEKAGFEVGDEIVSIDGKPPGDLLSLDQQMTRIARDEGRYVNVVVKREGEEKTLTVTPRLPRVIPGCVENHPVAVDTLGLAIGLSRIVESVVPNSPAESVDIQPGDEVVGFRFAISPEQAKDERYAGVNTKPIDLTDDVTGWGELAQNIHQMEAGTTFEISLKRNSETLNYSLKSVASKEDFLRPRGILLSQLQDTYRCSTWTEAFGLGANQTWRDVTRVWQFLVKLINGGISPKALGGPGTIALAATSEATAGTSRLLLFLTLLSANLAIVNFLPIPILDGGHMLFLAYEGIFRRPVTERVYVMLAYVGLFLILGLMLFVILMDATRIYSLFQ
jgi:regulator of sigma E protease